MASPEDVESVTKVRIVRAIAKVKEHCQEAIAKTAEARYVMASATIGEAASLCEVRTVKEGLHELGNLTWVNRAVGIDHHADIAHRQCKATGERVPLAAPCLSHNSYIRPQLTSDIDGSVDGVSIHKDDLVRIRGNASKDIGKIAGFVERRNYNRDSRPRVGINFTYRHGLPSHVVRATPGENWPTLVTRQDSAC